MKIDVSQPLGHEKTVMAIIASSLLLLAIGVPQMQLVDFNSNAVATLDSLATPVQSISAQELDIYKSGKLLAIDGEKVVVEYQGSQHTLSLQTAVAANDRIR